MTDASSGDERTFPPGAFLARAIELRAAGKTPSVPRRIWRGEIAALRAALDFANRSVPAEGFGPAVAHVPGQPLPAIVRDPGEGCRPDAAGIEDRRLRACAMLEALGVWEVGRDLARVMRHAPVARWVTATRAPSPESLVPHERAKQELDALLNWRSDDAEVWALRGILAYQMHRRDDAKKDFEESLRRDGRCALGLMGRGEMRLYEERFAEALEDVEAALVLEPADPWAWVLKGEACQYLRHYEAGLEAVRRSLALDPELVWALGVESEILRELGRHDEALRVLDRLVAQHPRPWSYALRARTRFNFRDQKAGMADLDAALAMEPDFIEGLAYRGEALRRVGRLEEGLKDLDRALELAPSFSRGYAWRGSLKRRLGRYEEAIADQEQALRLSPEYVFSYVDLAHCRRKLGRHGSAIEDMNRAVRLDPKSAWIYGEASLAGSTLEDYPELVSDLGRAVEEAPEGERRAWALAWRGETHLRAGRLDAAIADLDGALREAPLAWAHAWRGSARSCLKDWSGALEDLDASVRMDPRYPNAYGWRGGVLRQLGRYQEAVADLTRCLEMNPGCTWAFAWRGEARLQCGDFSGAVEDLERAVSLQPGYADSHAWLGEALRSLGRLQQAEAHFSRALELGPHNHALWQVYLGRALVRQGLGDAKASVEDFRQAARLAPDAARGELEAVLAKV